MQRFILVDHSISGLAGHHYEYAVHVLRAAQTAGYDPVLVTNRKFRETELPWKTLPLYEFGFWPEARSAAYWKLGVKVVAWLAPRVSLSHIRLRYSELALAWASRGQWSRYLRRRKGDGAPLPARAMVVAALTFFSVVRLLCGLLFAPALLLVGLPAWAGYAIIRYLTRAGRAIARGDQPDLAVSRRHVWNALRTVVNTLASPGQIVLRAISLAVSPLMRRKPARPHQAEAFGRDSSQMLRTLSPGKGDIIFFPTISEYDLRGLAERLDRTREGLDATWHFLFRRNIYTGRRPSYAAQEAGLEELRLVFERFQRSVLARRSFFYTDTEELTDQYDRLGIVRFQTLPVPHTYTASDRIPHAGPRRLTYLGDARTEKGFALLPELAASLEPGYLATGKARFILQCNYNIPGGEPPVAIARGELESMPGNYIEFHRNPLTSEQYRTLLLAADVNLLCYDPENYYARSSGILVESLAVGIPVIVPAGCWLSRQLLARYVEYVDELRAEMTRLSSTELPNMIWRGESSPAGRLKSGDLLRLHQDAPAELVLDLPHGATHVVIDAEFAMGGASMAVSLCEIGWDGEKGGCRTFLLETASGSNRTALSAELRAGVPRVVVAFSSSDPAQTAWLSALHVEFFRAPEDRSLPKGAAGLIYHSVAEIPALVADLLDNHEHYQRTAAAFSRRWREYHNPDRLLRDLERVAGLDRARGETPRLGAERVAV
jgi:hypothetical protein